LSFDPGEARVTAERSIYIEVDWSWMYLTFFVEVRFIHRRSTGDLAEKPVVPYQLNSM
jgi:hypothetical protein